MFGVRRPKYRPNWQAVRVVETPPLWEERWTRPLYFYPDVDSCVEEDYDFERDVRPHGAACWFNRVFPHQLLTQPSFDGFLASRTVVERNPEALTIARRVGLHRYYRVKRTFPIFGDCGAFSYVKEKHPPVTTRQVIDFYTSLDYDYGVSVDHMIINPRMDDRLYRYQLTAHNAEDFIREHRKLELPWEPVGAVQGWDQASYVRAAKWLVAMGYRYIAFGGIVRKSTAEVIALADAMHKAVPEGVKIHLFGVARLDGVKRFAECGIYSFDSLSYFKRALFGRYVGPNLVIYRTIRVPDINAPKLHRLGVSEGEATFLKVLSLTTLREFDAGRCTVDECLQAVLRYDAVFRKRTTKVVDAYRKLLSDAPWRSCDCDVCRRLGIEVVLTRGRNRSYRCGFHNTFVFYRAFRSIVG